jgi:hypothetical protein
VAAWWAGLAEESEARRREQEEVADQKVVEAAVERCSYALTVALGGEGAEEARWKLPILEEKVARVMEHRAEVRRWREENEVTVRRRQAAAAAAVEAAVAAAAQGRRRRSAAPARQAPRSHGTRRAPTRRRRATADVDLDVTVVAVRRGRVGWWVKEGGWAGFVTLSLALAGRHRGVPPE